MQRWARERAAPATPAAEASGARVAAAGPQEHPGAPSAIGMLIYVAAPRGAQMPAAAQACWVSDGVQESAGCCQAGSVQGSSLACAWSPAESCAHAYLCCPGPVFTRGHERPPPKLGSLCMRESTSEAGHGTTEPGTMVLAGADLYGAAEPTASEQLGGTCEGAGIIGSTQPGLPLCLAFPVDAHLHMAWCRASGYNASPAPALHHMRCAGCGFDVELRALHDYMWGAHSGIPWGGPDGSTCSHCGSG